MAGNIKALTSEELDFVVAKYKFDLFNDCIVVTTNGRKTLHDMNESFSLLLPLERRRIKITKKAIDLWVKRYYEKYSLIEVQNAINTLIVTFQNPNEENIDGQLERARLKLKTLFKEGVED